MKNNLYKVTCSNKTSVLLSHYDVFVVAENETAASQKALDKMKKLEYIYTSYVSKIELIAGDQILSPAILVI